MLFYCILIYFIFYHILFYFIIYFMIFFLLYYIVIYFILFYFNIFYHLILLYSFFLFYLIWSFFDSMLFYFKVNYQPFICPQLNPCADDDINVINAVQNQLFFRLISPEVSVDGSKSEVIEKGAGPHDQLTALKVAYTGRKIKAVNRFWMNGVSEMEGSRYFFLWK